MPDDGLCDDLALVSRRAVVLEGLEGTEAASDAKGHATCGEVMAWNVTSIAARMRGIILDSGAATSCRIPHIIPRDLQLQIAARHRLDTRGLPPARHGLRAERHRIKEQKRSVIAGPMMYQKHYPQSSRRQNGRVQK
ncbi:uncharacterized protein CLUP02_15048 [Colletotrichum lupini]|uniref:Uncharacterized protein n=1 Tax=Colletotrichum lupini TaxID=145971 RepID=A0A9Q8T5H5_9PEZI|nr:uncharacterized protein CLUP02_15048 [Colletotrichum lupini]UQC89517.1 hypothetical protein CLUP02_15048 [Colletotrichum lupini]